MSTATIVYHHEANSWWAESDEIPGFTALGSTFAEARTQAREGARFAGWDGPLIEMLEDGALVADGGWYAAGIRAVADRTASRVESNSPERPAVFTPTPHVHLGGVAR